MHFQQGSMSARPDLALYLLLKHRHTSPQHIRTYTHDYHKQHICIQNHTQTLVPARLPHTEHAKALLLYFINLVYIRLSKHPPTHTYIHTPQPHSTHSSSCFNTAFQHLCRACGSNSKLRMSPVQTVDTQAPEPLPQRLNQLAEESAEVGR